MVSVAVLIAATAALYFAQSVLQPIVLSVLLAFLLARPVSWLERRRIGRVPAVLIVATVAFLVLGSLGYVVWRQVESLADHLTDYSAEIERKFSRVRGSGGGMTKVFENFDRQFHKMSESAAPPPTTASTTGGTLEKVAAHAQDKLHDVADAAHIPPTTEPAGPPGSESNPVYTIGQSAPVPAYQRLIDYLGYLSGPLGTGGLVVVFVIFILLEREDLRDRFIAVISRGNYTVTTRALNDAAERISRYLVAQSIVNGSYGLIIGSGLFLIGLVFGHGTWFPSFVLWGLLCAILRFIPYVGPAVSSLFPIVLALAVYPQFSVAIAVAAMFIIVELVSNNVMEPWLYGASTGLSTIAILVAAIFWTWLWGSVGLLVATPLTVCIAVIGKYVPAMNFLHVLLGDEDALPPAVQYYQRLLAADRADAERIVAKVAEREGVRRVPDVVYLPALRLARRDRAQDALSPEAEKRIYDDTLAVIRPAGQTVAPAAPATVPADGTPLVLCYPAHHRADEVTLHVLAEALVPLGVKTAVMTTRQLPADVEAAVARDRPAFLVVAVMPPGGLPQARYLCRRLRRKFPDLPILVGYWGRLRHFDRLLVRLRKSGASYVLTNVEQTRGQIGAMLPKPPVSEPPAPDVAVS